MPKSGEIKTAKELGISDHDWVILAESLLLSRDLAYYLPHSPIGILHKMNVDYLEGYFGIKQNPPPKSLQDR